MTADAVMEDLSVMYNEAKRIKELFDITALMVVFMAVKFIVYYYLIEWSVFSFVYTLISIAITLGLYYSLVRSRIKHKRFVFGFLYIGLSIFMFADVMYFNYYNQTVSIEQFWQLSNVAKVPESFVATLIPLSIFILFDIPVVLHKFGNMVKNCDNNYVVKPKVRVMRITAVILFIIVAAINSFGSPGLAKITGDEFFINHVSDIFENTVGRLVNEDLEKDEVLRIIQANTSNVAAHDLNGIAKGRNVIVIQIEAMQNCMIGATYNGIELTPNINKLIDSDSLYFDNFYSNVGKGNTADAEFTALNSLYPGTDRECYTLYETNTFRGLPWLLKKEGYGTAAFHGYEGDFWNRENAYPYQGIDEFYSIEDLNDDDIIGLGISDKSLFRQAADLLAGKDGKFFSLLVTLSNHHPYSMDEELWEVPVKEEDEESKFASYLQTVHYTDEAIGEFIEELKDRGLYDNSIIVLYGDHHGLNKEMDDNDIYMKRFLGREYNYEDMFNVPLIINIPSSGINRTISTVGGQIDILPTLANLLGIELDRRYICGQDIVNADEGFVAFSAYIEDGSFITDGAIYEMSREQIYEEGHVWEPKSGRELNTKDYKKYYRKAVMLKEASRQLLNQNMIPEL